MISSILLAGFTQSLVIVGFLIKKTSQHTHFKLLMVIHIVFATDLFLLLAQQENWISNRINACWGAIYAILFFTFIRTCLGSKPSKKHIFAYFIPWVLLNISVADFLIFPDSTTLATRHVLSGYFLLIIYLFFAGWACITVYHYQKNREQYLADLSKDNVWLLWGICASLLLAISTIPFQYIFKTNLPLPQLLMSFFMFVIAYALLLNPQLLTFNSSLKERNSTELQDDEVSKLLLNQLNCLLDEQLVFTDPNLNLNSLAELLNTKPYILSQVINQHLGEKFYDLINRRRVEYTCRLFKAHPRKPILDIALRAGFNSKSTFNAAFKRYLNLTPTQYKTTQISPD
ncbi:AraC family transcriptional regulator [Pseudoalteromonas luteoviolacea]|uniref:AraC family transcriptional regulator n=1 Tax=Pseudoalteromonas luteoviolacea TaxID=43657 RepID=UPI0011504304|nr:helix-turn-helix domain-containing protein [Pseudoalteromonas luteoviolacea]TQF71416.1 AraC family transcriptional regulator [Pseudoalteromonas luteoviolacea]